MPDDWPERVRAVNIRIGKKPPSHKGIPAWNKGLKIGNGERHPLFKGDNALYGTKHDWVYRAKGAPDKCERCPKSGLKGHEIHWANKDHRYKRVVEDWIRLCVPCHAAYDKERRKLYAN